jgi:LmbE family N-acetylglucosaminyl deacetylase
MTQRVRAGGRRPVTSAAATAAALVALASGSLAAQPPRPASATSPRVAPASTPSVAPGIGLPVDVVVQPRDLGAGTLGAALQAIGTTTRVLMIAAHPDDEDTNLIAWLARGRHVETAYLSLTRGDGGQNLIGNELGDNLGVIRTQELHAARRLDGGRQYFSRAFDFGFSKSADESFEAWPRDSVLGDAVRVVRAFRPHVIVAVFTGTPRDGHGHHQVAGLLARLAYDQAADTLAFPVHTHGLPWSAATFYRASRFSPDEMTMRINVGEYAPLFGRSYAEIAAESRSQHKSQGFGALQRRGAQWDYLRREHARGAAADDARADASLFDGIDTTWAGLARRAGNARIQALLDSADAAFVEAKARHRAEAPHATVAPLARGLALVRAARDAIGDRPPLLHAAQPGFTATLVNAAGAPLSRREADRAGNAIRVDMPVGAHADPALWDALTLTEQRAAQALVLAAGVAVEATAPRRLLPAFETRKGSAVPDTMAVAISVFNRGRGEVRVRALGLAAADSSFEDQAIAPDSAFTVRRIARTPLLTMPWWRSTGRSGALFNAPVDARDDVQRQQQLELGAVVRVVVADVPVDVRVPVVYRVADPVRGDVQVPVAVVPGITVGLARAVEYARADVPIERQLRVSVLSSYPTPQDVSVQLQLPSGLTADSLARERTLEPDVALTLTFTVRGRLPEGMHELKAVAVHRNTAAQAGYATIDYDHIAPQRVYGVSQLQLSAVPVALRAGVRVGYIAGVSDDGLAALRALDVPVEELSTDRLTATDLSRYTTIVIGPRAYQVSDALRAANPRLFAWAEAGGTLVVQYGQFEMAEPGLMPFPVTFTRPAARVTREEAPVTMLDPDASLLRVPNRIGATDWDAWVQERALYIPSTFDGRYRAFVEMHDPDEPANRGAMLAAPLGRGLYVYTSLALFRQFPYGVPGGARLLVNLVSARGSDLPVSR